MQVISLFTSGVMLGLKLAQVTALPAMWGRLSKWRSMAQPLCEAADAEGTELHEALADTTDAPITAEEYVAMLHQVEAAILALACRAGPHVAADKWHLRKLAHKFAMLAANTHLPNAKPGAKPGAPLAGPQVPALSDPPVDWSAWRPHRHAPHAYLRPCEISIGLHGRIAPAFCVQVTGRVQSALADSDLVGECEPRASRALAVQALHTPPSSVSRCAAGACTGMQGGIEACMPVRCF